MSREGSKKIRNQKKSILRHVTEWILCLGVALALAYLVVAFLGQRTRVIGASMETALSDGDNIIVDKISYHFREPKRFEIVVFPVEEDEPVYYIKRIIGLPGERVQIISGKVYINDEVLTEYYGTELMDDPGMFVYPITLREDEYFLLGDNRNNSRDSRDLHVGPLPGESIVGRAWFRIFPFEGLGVIEYASDDGRD